MSSPSPLEITVGRNLEAFRIHQRRCRNVGLRVNVVLGGEVMVQLGKLEGVLSKRKSVFLQTNGKGMRTWCYKVDL